MEPVQYEEMLPDELEEALERYPVAYVLVGSPEWHARHLSLGNDAIKAKLDELLADDCAVARRFHELRA